MQCIQQAVMIQRNKIRPGRILETLRTLFPDHLDLPSETEIQQRIAGLTAKYKKHGTIHVTRGIQDPFKTVLSNIVQESLYTIKPKGAIDIFKARTIEMLIVMNTCWKQK
jgi:hypothetical protein